MKIGDLASSAVSNTFRSKTRTVLTILAIFVGAFTLTLTNGLGTGINRYITDTVASFGADDLMTVSAKVDEQIAGNAAAGEPVEYDPDAIATGLPGFAATPITPDDISTIEATPGIERVHASKNVTADYIQHGDNEKWVIQLSPFVPGQTLQLAAGDAPSENGMAAEVAIPSSHLEALGFDDGDEAVGSTVTIAVSDPTRTQHGVEAIITGVTEANLAGGGGSATPNAALTDQLFALQNTGVPLEQQERFMSVSAWFDPDFTQDEIDALKASLETEGFTGVTVADQLGGFTTVIDAIVLLLNGFAVIALLAASFGIVNTLLMSVQERTREIGLMKAMGMSSGRVFTLFSFEALFIGFLGSAIGVGVGMLVGTVVSGVLADGFFADLPGLTLIAFDPGAIAVTVLIIMGVAFLAGTLPAARAARADPVTSLRYE